MGRNAARTKTTLITYALRFPSAWEDHPWEETVAKIGKKVFAFFGGGTDQNGRVYPPTLTVKLDESHAQALTSTGVEPSGYGLGRSGWVTIDLSNTTVPSAVLRDWIEESYRLIAPKRELARLEGERPISVSRRDA